MSSLPAGARFRPPPEGSAGGRDGPAPLALVDCACGADLLLDLFRGAPSGRRLAAGPFGLADEPDGLLAAGRRWAPTGAVWPGRAGPAAFPGSSDGAAWTRPVSYGLPPWVGSSGLADWAPLALAGPLFAMWALLPIAVRGFLATGGFEMPPAFGPSAP